MNRIVFVVPQMSRLGGVALHYKGLRNFWTEDVRYCEMFFSRKTGILFRLWTLFRNFVAFFTILITWSPTHIIFNTSLKKGFYSQYYLWRIAKLFKKKTGLFIHGWDIEKEDYYLENSRCKTILDGVDGIFLLSSSFKKSIEKRNISTPIFLVTTKVDNELLNGFVFDKKEFQNRRFLFVARLIKQKGIIEAIEAFRIVQQKYPDASFVIVGDGPDRDEVEKYIVENHVENVAVLGKLSGAQLTKVYSRADYYFLLTSWGEGLPGSLLEAISFGLVPIVRSVGGITDIFEDGKMGIMSERTDPEYYARRIIDLMETPEKAKKMSKTNYNIGQEKFLASIVAKRLEAIISEL